VTRAERPIVQRLVILIQSHWAGDVWSVEELLGPDEAFYQCCLARVRNHFRDVGLIDFFNEQDDVVRVAEHLGLDISKHWEPRKALLETCSDDELSSFAADLEVDSNGPREKLIARLIDLWQPGWIPAAFQPQKKPAKKSRKAS
jgi:hypothetical protein